MAKIAYLECPTGIAGDMCLGALIHAGVPLKVLEEQLDRLGISDEFKLAADSIYHNGQLATKVSVNLLASAGQIQTAEDGADIHATFGDHHSGATPSGAHAHASARHLPEIQQLILKAGLPERVTQWSLEIFQRLAEAEAAVHGVSIAEIHFHEVGATDAIVDIVGTCIGLDWLGIEQIYCSPLPTGGGTIKAAHGLLPVPTPAVLKLWETHQVPIYSNGIQREMVTPTGAAIAVTLSNQFGPPPAMRLQRVGLGAGARRFPIPNILRLWIGEGELVSGQAQVQAHPHAIPEKKVLPFTQGHDHAHSHPQAHFHSSSHSGTVSGFTPCSGTITVLETQIDDLNPQAIGYLYDLLFAAGAVDVFTQAIGMKKSRPGILLTVLCPAERGSDCETIIFRETSTLGIRRSQQERALLNREIQWIETDYGVVRVKVSWAGDDRAAGLMQVQPEYEDCAVIARNYQLPWREVHRQVLSHWYAHRQDNCHVPV